METIWDFNNIFPQSDSVVTVGTFDGIHKGHQEIITNLVAGAKSLNAKSTLVTFEPHPGLVVGNRGKIPLNLLTTIEEKSKLLESMGLDRLIVTNFTSAFASMTAEEFITQILLEKLHMKRIIIGHDHSFGKNRQGNIDLLSDFGKDNDFSLESLSPVTIKDEIVSSTLVRKLVYEGNVEKASNLLGREYSITGQIVKGDGRGRELGYPTANLKPYSQYKLIPKEGVYATHIKIDGEIFNSVTYVGPRPTFNLSHKVIEAHIYDFDRDIYNKHVELYFTKFIRDDIKFNSAHELLPQIKHDKETAFEILKQL